MCVGGGGGGGEGRRGVDGGGKGVYLTSPGRPTEIDLQLAAGR